MRVKVVLACSQCHARNYTLTKNKQTQPQRLEVKKYCPRCDQHTAHRESK